MKNFKSWKDSGEVKLAPLTGFFGTNSSGKSSLLQMLLLLKQTVGSDEILSFGDDNSLVNLGNFREAIHQHNLEATLVLKFGGKIPEPLKVEVYGRKRSDTFRRAYLPVSVNSFVFYTAIGQNNGKLWIENLSYRLESVDVIDSENQMGRFKPCVHWNKERTIHSDSFNQMYEINQKEVKNCYRKFIAVVIAYERVNDEKATILQALDRKWEQFRNAFEQESVQIDFLCPPENET